MSGLTEQQREMHVCCLKRRLCTEDHFHERGVARLIADERERIAQEIEAHRDANRAGPGFVPFGGGEPSWVGDQFYNEAARIVRGGAA